MTPDELAQMKKLEGDLLEECTKRVEAEANVRNLERINRALATTSEALAARARLAVQALKQYASFSNSENASIALIGKPASEALHAIGELPPA